MFILYGFDGKSWGNLAEFSDRRDYRTRVITTAEQRIAEAKTPDGVNAAELMKEFVSGKYFYPATCRKKVMRALRRFDEVGISNDVCEALDGMSDERWVRFALLKENESVNGCVESGFDKEI